MNVNQLISNIEASFKTYFPLGYINIVNESDDRERIQVFIGLIGNVADVSNGIVQNDPMRHEFIVEQKDDKLVAVKWYGDLSCKPVDPLSLVAIESINTKFRKTTGDVDKICKMYDKWFKQLKELVVKHKDNIHNVKMYQKYI